MPIAPDDEYPVRRLASAVGPVAATKGVLTAFTAVKTSVIIENEAPGVTVKDGFGRVVPLALEGGRSSRLAEPRVALTSAERPGARANKRPDRP